jgi:hypothetical protein
MVTIVAPLGLRFRDVVTGGFVGDGLTVTLRDPVKPTTRVQAFPNRSGIYVVHHAPGLRELEQGAGDDEFWNNLPPAKKFVVAVTDVMERFQPFQFTADLPARHIFNWTSPFGTSPPGSVSSVPLYSAPVRSVPPGLAIVRADLWDVVHDLPAAWAVLEVYLNNQLIARGIADEKGRIALIFPYPAPRPFVVASPPGSPVSSPPIATGPPLTEQEWPITIRALYMLRPPLPPLLTEFGLEPQLPDLGTTLSQPEATLWADDLATQSLGEVSLRYGRELTLRSKRASSPPTFRSVLFITPAGSPP